MQGIQNFGKVLRTKRSWGQHEQMEAEATDREAGRTDGRYKDRAFQIPSCFMNEKNLKYSQVKGL